MAKAIPITLTKQQAYSVIRALEYSQDFENFTPSDPVNKHIQRIIDKIKQEMEK